ncbi:MAG: hypothetical protein JJ908_13830 [Rhizobiales bacterium]|nr:hypothetical protein [Hyphomicrobiales bacterium]MBO6699907.1 hypothetical protein [Hyphomicrobiales bacterium]MBO6737445.1 hypothetical protein [Hyphomicrobiales bacterium]MBO6911481.1 hypothetical protein [Hyphomicrobiales bacterium]MBO6955219.1 hypothetical protein [Hyphomicrobiales bacterium]
MTAIKSSLAISTKNALMGTTTPMNRRRRKVGLSAAGALCGLGLLATPGVAQITCPDGVFSIAAEPELAPQMCAIASDAREGLLTCGIELDRPLQIEMVEDLPTGCIGEYHCDQDRITLLSPQAVRNELGDDHHPLRQIDPETYLASVLVHELVHAALESMPCPFISCVASQEYVAYAMQMRSLPPNARSALLTRPSLDRTITDEEINPIIAQMAPDLFMQKAWLHFSQQEDPCGFVQRIAAGAFLFDHDMH